jgi:hypothetical protein
MSWLVARVVSTGELVEAPETSALTSFDALAPDFQVWCSRPGEERPVVIRRGDLQRATEYAGMRLFDPLKGPEQLTA